MIAQNISTKAEMLSEELQKEVLDYIEFLLQKYPPVATPKGFRFDWEGDLSVEHLTSVELQHKALEWR